MGETRTYAVWQRKTFLFFAGMHSDLGNNSLVRTTNRVKGFAMFLGNRNRESAARVSPNSKWGDRTGDRMNVKALRVHLHGRSSYLFLGNASVPRVVG